MDANTHSILLAAIAAIPPTIVATASWLSSKRNEKKLEEVHLLVNSNLASVKVDLQRATDLVQKLLEEKANGQKT